LLLYFFSLLLVAVNPILRLSLWLRIARRYVPQLVFALPTLFVFAQTAMPSVAWPSALAMPRGTMAAPGNQIVKRWYTPI